ncbi:glycosyltransferase family 9 protein [Mucilaginibacter sp.]|uniref:glycosyltransferase family 9 protein n=1 Tax=Mucilaginibacter sp. TaxID=1882438 RepID=UPI0032676578
MAQNRNLFRLTRFILLKLPYLFRFLAWSRPTRKRLLIVKADAIGDYILFRNFIGKIKLSEKYRNYEIDLLGNQVWESLTTDYDAQYIGKFFFTKPYQLYHQPSAVFKLGLVLFRRGYSIILNPSSTRLLVTDGLIGMAAAKESLGWESNTEGIDAKYKCKTDEFYTTRLTLPSTIYHEFHRNKFFFDNVLNERTLIEGPMLPVKQTAKTGIMIFPGAGIKKRGWETDKCVALIKLILQNSAENVTIAGGPDEVIVNDAICQQVNSERLINLTGKTTLPQLVQKVAASVLLVGNDSGAIHMAVATGTSSVCLTGGGHFNRFVPYPDDFANAPVCVYQKLDCYYCNWNCIYQTAADERYPCISVITVDAAWQAVQPLLPA